MAPSLFKTVGAAAVALAAGAGATKSYSYKVTEVYNSTNFFDKFDFFSVRISIVPLVLVRVI